MSDAYDDLVSYLVLPTLDNPTMGSEHETPPFASALP